MIVAVSRRSRIIFLIMSWISAMSSFKRLVGFSVTSIDVLSSFNSQIYYVFSLESINVSTWSPAASVVFAYRMFYFSSPWIISWALISSCGFWCVRRHVEFEFRSYILLKSLLGTLKSDWKLMSYYSSSVGVTVAFSALLTALHTSPW